MLCQVCNGNKTLFFCTHCINTLSDPDVTTIRLQLRQIRALNEELKFRIEKLLTFISNGGSGSVSKLTAGPDPDPDPDPNPSLASASTSEIMFYHRMREVSLLKKRKRNDRIRTWITYMMNTVEQKKRELAKYQGLLQLKTFSTPLMITSGDLQTEWTETITQVQNMLHRRQVAAQNELTSWSLVRRTDGRFEIPYAMFFQPIISLRNALKLPGQLIALSVLRITQYLQILKQIYSFNLPFTLGPSFTPKYVTELHQQDIYRNLIRWLTIISINLVVALQKLRLPPVRQRFPEIGKLLDDYDIDGLFYCLANRLEVRVARTIEVSQDFYDVSKIVSEKLLYGSGASDGCLQGEDQQSVGSADRWFVVNGRL